jgi:hypothetical protein
MAQGTNHQCLALIPRSLHYLYSIRSLSHLLRDGSPCPPPTPQRIALLSNRELRNTRTSSC